MKNYSEVTEPKDIATKEYADSKQTKINVTGMLQGTGNGGVVQATAGTDYLTPANGDAKYLQLTGGTLTGNLTGQYLTGTWLQTTAATTDNNLNKLAVIDDSGRIYMRDVSSLPGGGASGGGAATYLSATQPASASTGDVWYKIL